MSRRNKRSLVIDASIVRAAGSEEALYPLPIQCREFLLAVLKEDHRYVMTPKLEAEWKRHRSDFASTWRTSMIRKGREVYCNPTEEQIGLELETLTISAEILAIMQKDLPLVEAALETDKTIAALDDKARRHFADAAAHIEAIAPIIWVNPSRKAEQAIVWLRGGAKPEIKRQLDYRVEGDCPHCNGALHAYAFVENTRCPACHKQILLNDQQFLPAHEK